MRVRMNVTRSLGMGCFGIDDVAVVLNGAGKGLPILSGHEPLPPTFSNGEFEVFSVGNYPNPVRDVHTTRFTVKGTGIDEIRITIYDQSGSLVFDSDWQPNGYDWHVESNLGETLANGVYIYVVAVKGVNGELKVINSQKLAVYR